MSNIKQSYQEYKCYKLMKEVHKSAFDKLAIHYGQILNKGCPIGDTLYTAHDFDKHCNNIYKIISDIILLNYNEKMFSSKELFILNLSVLFHDISMSINPHWDRKKHSKQSADYVKSEEENTSSVLNSEKDNDLTHNDIKAIREIIKAHSDIKDGSVLKEENGIMNPELTFKMSGDINGKALAAILRLADELDVTSDRLGNKVFANQLSTENDEERISIKHWRRLNYFKMVSYDKNDTSCLELHCDDEYLYDNSDDIQNIISDIVEIKNKIEIELTTLSTEVFNKEENAKIGFRFNKIKIITKNKEVQCALDPISNFNNKVETISIKNNEYESSNENMDTVIPKNSTPEILSQKVNEVLRKHIMDNNLLEGGHYKLNKKYCSRDWIDTNEIIETNEICRICIEEFASHCGKKGYDKNSIIIGLDLEGSIIASLLAMRTNLPFQFVIPAKSKDRNSVNDIEHELPSGKNIIIVTDAVCTYDTICTTIDRYNLGGRVVAIYSLLYRESAIKDTKEIESLKKITYCINKDFSMEVIKRDECKYKGSKCIAKNNEVEV